MRASQRPAHPLTDVFQQFGLAEPSDTPQVLHGGSQPIYRCGDLVFKRIRPTSLENNYSPELSAWISAFSAALPQEGFRIPRPVQTVRKQWITPQGWTAMTYLEGRPPAPEEIPACITALKSFHRAIARVPIHPRMRNNQTAWGKAHRWCQGELPARIQPELRELVGQLAALRRPVQGSPAQLIHGDPSPANFLIQPGQPPAILDFSPFWGPPELSLAIFANFAGPRRGDVSVLEYFRDVPNFKQFLIRAALRMLLVVSALNGLDDWHTERRAAELVIAWVTTAPPAPGDTL